jgi:Tol biopolymer transport system component
MLSTTKAPGNLTFPTASPDGGKLGYVSSQTGNGDVRTWDRSTDKFSQLTDTDGTESFPLYSSDGKKLLFTRKANNTEDVFELDVATNTERSVVGGNGDQSRPIYAANGQVVYFTSERGSGLWDIAVVDAAGAKRTLAKDVRLPERSRPAVTSDGQWVAWVSSDPTLNMKVMLTKLDGSRSVEYATEFNTCGEPAVGIQAGRVMLAFTYLMDSGASWRHLWVDDITSLL